MSLSDTDQNLCDLIDQIDNLDTLIDGLTDHLGRLPTEDEVYDFIFGDDNARKTIWDQTNQENKEHG